MEDFVATLNRMIRENSIDANRISDGYHTFGELYEHRVALFIALCHTLNKLPFPRHSLFPSSTFTWKSKIHSDGTILSGWFLAGIGVESGKQITYHLPDSKWESLRVTELDRAPEFDGHSPADVLMRLAELPGRIL